MFRNNPQLWRIARNFAVELIVYAVLLTVYFLLVLRYLGEPLARLFTTKLALYAPVALLLIVVQGVVLDTVTSLLVRLVGIEHAGHQQH